MWQTESFRRVTVNIVEVTARRVLAKIGMMTSASRGSAASAGGAERKGSLFGRWSSKTPVDNT
ncbi:hypothetical protein SEA_JABIRU_72 [Mycobacterium phage Jabiru]|nr:hypothetical protein SEA_JABIRU_72 [Mycobacterium phage Jabiru]